MRIASLGSGSRGNATLVQQGDTTLLIDCGFSLRQFTRRLQQLELEPGAITAALLTHEHSDHSCGIARLCTRHNIPIWTAIGTARKVFEPGVKFRALVAEEAIEIGEIHVLPVTVPHDATEPLQFVLQQRNNGKRLGILTDAGHVTGHIVETYSGLDGLLLEFNYDPEMLESGPYPAALKQRVGGRLGHLSNQQSLELLERIDTRNLGCLIAAHISEKNNSPEIVNNHLRKIANMPLPVLASQDSGFDWIDI